MSTSDKIFRPKMSRPSLRFLTNHNNGWDAYSLFVALQNCSGTVSTELFRIDPEQFWHPFSLSKTNCSLEFNFSWVIGVIIYRKRRNFRWGLHVIFMGKQHPQKLNPQKFAHTYPQKFNSRSIVTMKISTFTVHSKTRLLHWKHTH